MSCERSCIGKTSDWLLGKQGCESRSLKEEKDERNFPSSCEIVKSLSKIIRLNIFSCFLYKAVLKVQPKLLLS